MGIIKTFVFFDLETTGLPGYEYNRTKITELSFIAAERDHIQDSKYGEVPRVLQKLTLCVYPQRPIQNGSTLVTGLTNDLLENQKPFDENTCEIIRLFLNQLPKPVCLVAHNGDEFDYKILQKELKNSNQYLFDEILCVDSLKAFRNFHSCNIGPDTSNSLGVSIIAPLKIEQGNVCEYGVANSEANAKNYIIGINLSEDIKILNETTPKRQTSNDKVRQLNNLKAKRNHNISGHAIAKKRLCFTPSAQKVSFKLSDIYKRIFNKDYIDCHRAENDAMMLLHCVVAYGNGFMHWADKNASTLSSIPSL